MQEKDFIAAQLKTARSKLGVTQKAFAAKIGMALPSYKDYEAGKTMPGSAALVRFAQAGINIHWLVTGEGPAFLTGQAQEAHELFVREYAGDKEAARIREERERKFGERLQEVLYATESVVQDLGIDLDVAQRSNLNAMVVKLYIKNEHQPDPDVIARLARSFKPDSPAS